MLFTQHILSKTILTMTRTNGRREKENSFSIFSDDDIRTILGHIVPVIDKISDFSGRSHLYFFSTRISYPVQGTFRVSQSSDFLLDFFPEKISDLDWQQRFLFAQLLKIAIDDELICCRSRPCMKLNQITHLFCSFPRRVDEFPSDPVKLPVACVGFIGRTRSRWSR